MGTRLPVFLYLTVFCIFSAGCLGQQISSRPLITQPVIESQLTTLKGNTHPLAQPKYDVGTAPPDLPMNRMLLVLKRSPEQEHALRALLDDQQDKTSPHYHKWLTPDEFGNQFGPADQDIQTVTGWLQSHGFAVNRIAHGRSVIEFSGTEAQIEEAFHTAIHKYAVNGEEHWANASDPQIPTALTPVISGIWSLHNFRKKPQLKILDQKITAKYRPGSRPEFTSGTLHALAPADFYKIYNVNPLVMGRANISIVARSNIDPQDPLYFHYWTYDQATGPTVILNGPDPGALGGGDEVEADLDATWANAVAPTQGVFLIVSASTNSTDGVDLSEEYIIDHNFGDVMSESFGDCEANYTNSEATGISTLAEQAAAQGITYVVASGDSGAEGCDNPNTETIATHPVSVNVLASTPYTVAVGGTMFNEHGQPNTYWGSTDPVTLGSALAYIPENVWNESCTTAQCGKNAGIWAGGGGTSSFFSRPSWQAGVSGIPNDNLRHLPDVAFTAAAHDPYLLCVQGSCVPDAQGLIHFYGISGTSAATPAFAGIMSMVAAAEGSRLGQPNYVLYKLAANENLGQCNASSTTSTPASSCIFHDVTAGNNAVPGEVGYSSSTAMYQSGTGYDLATGLGSVNAANLISQWNTISFSPTSTTFSISPTTAVHGSPLGVSGTVTSNSGTGIPTGPVWLVQTGYPHGNLVGDSTADIFTLDPTGSFTGVSHLLPGGTYQVNAHYAGDGTYAGSDSSPLVQITIQPESTTTTFSVLTTNSTGNLVPFTGGPYGTPVYLQAHLSWASGYGAPSSYVNFWDKNNGIASVYLDSHGNGTTTALTQIPAGTHSITAGYYGDNSLNTSVDLTPVNFTIAQVLTKTTLNSQQTAHSFVLTAIISASSIGSPATGLVTFSSGGTTLGTVPLASGSTSNGTSQATASFDATQLPAGQYSVVASYPGDANYAASSSAVMTLNLVADFALSNGGISSQTVSAGTTAQYINDLAVTPFFGFPSAVNVSCTSSAPQTNCTVNPSSYPLSSGAGVGTVSVTTTPRTAAEITWPLSRPPFRLIGIGIMSLFVMTLITVPSHRRRSHFSVFLSVVFLVMLLGTTLVGCGGGNTTGNNGGGQTGTPAGTYTVTVTGLSGTVSHTTTFSLIVQ